MSLPPPPWTCGKILKFLELLESEPVIWNPNHKFHKRKLKVHDAWNRLSGRLENTPIQELKNKRKSLMATFRPLLRKKKTSMRSGASEDEVENPSWFAFDVMERFLGQIYEYYNMEETMDTESHHASHSDESQPPTSRRRQQNVDIPFSPSSEEDVEIPVPTTSPDQQVSSPLQSISGFSQSYRKISSLDDAETKVSQSLDTLNHILRDKIIQPTTVEDECDIYAKLLAKRLRKYPEYMQRKLMYQIDGFLLENPCPTKLAPRRQPSARSSSPQSQYFDYSFPERSSITFVPQSPHFDYQTAHSPIQNVDPLRRPSNSNASEHSDYHKVKSSIHIPRKRVKPRPLSVSNASSASSSKYTIPPHSVYVEQQQSPVSEFEIKISIPETNDSQ